jgi:hypothetical protein
MHPPSDISQQFKSIFHAGKRFWKSSCESCHHISSECLPVDAELIFLKCASILGSIELCEI